MADSDSKSTVSIREAFAREGIIQQGGPRTAPEQRMYWRDLGCIVWLIFERVGRKLSPDDRIGFLKRMMRDEASTSVIQGLIEELLVANPDPPQGSFLRWGLKAMGSYGASVHARTVLGISLQTLDGIARVMMLAQHVEYGFPTIQLGHKLAASLVTTRVPEEIVDSMELPWPVFEIELPTGLLSSATVDEDGVVAEDPLHSMLVGRLEGTFVDDGSGRRSPHSHAYIAHGRLDSLWNIKFELRDLGDIVELPNMGKLEDDPWPDARFNDVKLHMTPTEHDRRTMHLLARLFVNVALTMTASGNSRSIGKGHAVPAPSSVTGRRRDCPVPMSRVFQLTQPVRHDFRDVVRDYVRGGGKSPTVQGFVVGHWKMQPFGAGRAQRRAQFVEPYWRGPEDAPIAMRSHKLK